MENYLHLRVTHVGAPHQPVVSKELIFLYLVFDWTLLILTKYIKEQFYRVDEMTRDFIGLVHEIKLIFIITDDRQAAVALFCSRPRMRSRMRFFDPIILTMLL